MTGGQRVLLRCAVGVAEHVYDGYGKTICLSDDKDNKEFQSSGNWPIIVIGRGKRLRFMNVKIEVSRLALIIVHE